MIIPRFSLAWLLGLVVFSAVSFAALRSPSPLWSATLFTGTVALLLAGVLFAAYRASETRASWLGFVLFAGTYILISFGSETARANLLPVWLLWNLVGQDIDRAFRLQGVTSSLAAIPFGLLGAVLGRYLFRSQSTRPASAERNCPSRARGVPNERLQTAAAERHPGC